MTPRSSQVILWTPRALAILFACFLAIFALDVFGEGYTPWQTAVALVMHLIPSFVVLACLGVAWRWPLSGVFLFPLLTVLYLLWTAGRFPWSTYLVVACPPLLLGLLFLISWWSKGQ